MAKISVIYPATKPSADKVEMNAGAASALDLGKGSTASDGFMALSTLQGTAIGNVVCSVRTDFLSKVGDKYVPLDGRIVSSLTYPEFAKAVNIGSGMAWTLASGTNASSISLFAARNSRILMSSNGILRSDDNGISWTQCAGVTGIAFYCFTFGQNDRIIGASNKGIWYSDDNGLTWVQTNKKDGGFSYVVVGLNNRLITGAVNIGILYSDNNGLDWVENTTTNIRVIAKMFRIQNDRLIGLHGGGISYSDNNGLNWTQSSLKDACTALSSLAITPSNRIILGTNATGIWYSDNNGQDWTKCKVTANFTGFILGPKNRVIAAGGNGIWFSDNNGIDWLPSNISSTLNAVIAAQNNRLLACGNNIGVWKCDPTDYWLPTIPNFYIRMK